MRLRIVAIFFLYNLLIFIGLFRYLNFSSPHHEPQSSTAIVHSPENWKCVIPATLQKIYTYVDDADNISVDTSRLLSLWSSSWRQNRWDPIILDRTTAKESEYYENAIGILSASKRSASDRVELTNLVSKYCAMAAIGGGFLSDYRVLNYEFAPIYQLLTHFTYYHPLMGLISANVQSYVAMVTQLTSSDMLNPDVTINCCLPQVLKLSHGSDVKVKFLHF